MTANDQWTPVIQEFDDVDMVLVPAGCFMMGTEDGDSSEQPVHEQCFDEPFWIDRYEVTQADFARLGGTQVTTPGFSGDFRPVEQITWFEARDFCIEQRGGRLPTEAEWEFAARGPDDLMYTWGNEFVGDNVVYVGNSNGQTAEVGSRPGGVSWVGAYDLSGNVWEWVSSVYEEYPYATDDGREDLYRMDDRVLRGGSFNFTFVLLQAADRDWNSPDTDNLNVGFRCSRDYTVAVEQADVADDADSEALPTIVVEGPIPTVTANDQWTPVVQEFDGVEMVLVPPGCFMMGSTNGDSHEMPAHEVCFDNPFWIDRYEVTNAQYGSSGYREGDDQPRERVTWLEAQAHCQSRAARLPTEAEWEYSASGPDDLEYPWGNAFVAENVIYSDGSVFETAPVGSRPGGISWVGAFDLSGNVWEWTNTIYDESRFPYPYVPDDGRETLDNADAVHVLRGGSWGSDQWYVRTFVRVRPNAGEKSAYWGLRCSRDYTVASEQVDVAEDADSEALPTVAFEEPIPTVTVSEPETSVVQAFNGVEMVLVPAGCFMMGTDEGDSSEQPVHEQCFDEPFWIDRYEVTNAQYGSSGRFEGDDRPRENDNWFDALLHCRGRDARLPNEAEWEYAARGPNSFKYPWGNEFEPSNVVYRQNSNGQTANVGSRPDGASWVGALDMSGNVQEWTSTIYDNVELTREFRYPYNRRDGREVVNRPYVFRVIRGGAYNDRFESMYAANRGLKDPLTSGSDTGFRCARDYE